MKNSLRFAGLNRFKQLLSGKHLLLMLAMSLLSMTVNAQTIVKSLAELRAAVQQSDQTIILQPGNYNIKDLPSDSRFFPLSGSNNTVILTGVYIDFPVGSSKEAHFQFTGNNNILRGGEFENTYQSGLKEVTDFVAYNNDRNNLAYGCDPHIIFTGNGNTVVGTKMTVRGSFPYGYGSYFGIGAVSVFGLSKRGGIAVQGPNTTIDSCELQMKAFGHGIYLQSAANNTVIKNTLVEGTVRPTNEMLAEGQGSLPYQNNFKDNDGNNIPPNEMESLCEDGIRTYGGGGSVTVENCTVKKMRGGVRLYLEPNATVTNTTAIDCGNVNWNMPSNGTITNSYGNFTYAPLSDFRLSRNNIKAEWTIIPSPNAIGAHNLADVLGSGHTLVFHRSPGPLDSNLRAIVVTGKNSTITNETEYPIILESTSSGNTIVSCGAVINNGTGNSVKQNNCTFDALLTVQAEDYTAMSGVEKIATTDYEGVGSVISNIDANDWMEYKIVIPTSGMYSFDYRVTSAINANFSVKLKDKLIENVSFNATGADDSWSSIQSASPVYLSAGTDTIRILSNVAGWKLNWISLTPQCYDTPIIPYIKTIDALGAELSYELSTQVNAFPGITVSLQPENIIGGSWKWSGPNGFSSTAREVNFTNIQKTNSGNYVVTYTNYCGQKTEKTFVVNVIESLTIEAENYDTMSGLVTETCTDEGLGSNLTDISVNDWMEYKINVPFNATYTLSYRVASETTGGEFIVSSQGKTIDNVVFNAIGGAQTWTTVSSATPVYLKAGEHTLRITSKKADWKLNWMKLTGIQLVAPCNLPYTNAGFSISNKTHEWTSGAMDISCVSDVNVYIDVEGLGAMDNSDYVNLYYRLNGGALVPIAQKTGSFAKKMEWVQKLSGSTIEIVIKGYTSSTAKTYNVSNIVVFKGMDSFAKIEAENYSANNGTSKETTTDTGGGINVGSIRQDNWLMYSAIDLTPVNNILVRVASIYNGSTIEVRLGSATGTLIGTIAVPNTGKWQTWQTVSTPITDVSGVYDVYLVFKTVSSYVCNINWLQFSYVNVNPSGINELQVNQKLVLYPNPVHDYLTVSENSGAQLEIYNQLGALVLKEKINNDKQQISMKGLNSGLYVAKLINNSLMKSYKLIKK